MRLNKKTVALIIISFLMLVLPFLTMAANNDVYTENTKNLSYFANVFGPARDPRTIAVGILKAFLGLLGVIFAGYMVYGGYVWMTAGGNEDRVTKAKDTIRHAIIGLAVLLAAWGITHFVFNALLETYI